MKRHLQLLSVIALVLCSFAANAQVILYVESPPSVEGSYSITYVGPPDWGVDMTTVSVTDTLVLVDDGTAADSLGCNSLVNGSAVNGKIAVVYRGDCEFGTKALNAQLAGAVGVMVIALPPGGSSRFVSRSPTASSTGSSRRTSTATWRSRSAR